MTRKSKLPPLLSLSSLRVLLGGFSLLGPPASSEDVSAPDLYLMCDCCCFAMKFYTCGVQRTYVIGSPFLMRSCCPPSAPRIWEIIKKESGDGGKEIRGRPAKLMGWCCSQPASALFYGRNLQNLSFLPLPAPPLGVQHCWVFTLRFRRILLRLIFCSGALFLYIYFPWHASYKFLSSEWSRKHFIILVFFSARVFLADGFFCKESVYVQTWKLQNSQMTSIKKAWCFIFYFN